MPKFALRPGRVGVTILIDPELRTALQLLSRHQRIPQGDIVSAALRGHIMRAVQHVRGTTEFGAALIQWAADQEGE
jgi:hypothetical protein